MNIEVRELGEDFRFISSVRNLLPALKNSCISSPVNLVAAASKFGLVFVAFCSEIKVYQTCDLVDGNNTDAFGKCTLPAGLTHLAVSCDNLTLLAAGTCLDGYPLAFYFDTRVFITKSQNYSYFYAAPLSYFQNALIESISWNPTDPGCLAVAISTGEISLIQIKEKSVLYTTTSIGASFVAWSAKGKQLAVGTHIGTLHLFKTDLTPVRIVQPPIIDNIGQVISINWFSNTEFFVCYRKNGAFPILCHVTAPKNSTAIYVNMDDICYSGDTASRQHTYYASYVAEWSLLFVLSSHSSDLAILGKVINNTNVWCQWVPEDGSRAALQFIKVVEETFPLGFCTVLCSQKKFSGNDDSMKGPFPVLLSLSTGGQLNIFHMENKISRDTLQIITAQPLTSAGAARTYEQYGTTVVKASSTLPSHIQLQDGFDSSKIVASTPIRTTDSNTLPPTTPLDNSALIFAQPEAHNTITTETFPSTPKGSAGQVFEAMSPHSPITLNQPSTISSPTQFVEQQIKINSIGATNQPLSGQNMQNSSTSSSFIIQPLRTISNVTNPKSSAHQLLQDNSNIGSPTFLVDPLQNTTNNSTTQPFVGQPLNTRNIAISSPSVVQCVPINSNLATTQPLAVQQQKYSNIDIASSFNGQHVNIIKSSNIATPLSSKSQTQLNGRTTVQPVPSPGHTSDSVGKPALSNGIPKRMKAKLLQHITDELVNFESELIGHEKSNIQFNLKVGNDEDKKGISNLVSNMSKWIDDMKSTTEEQHSEISGLHQGVLENYALYEDAKVQGHSKISLRNQTYLQLRPLDPYSRRKLDEIRSKYHYLQSQISEVNTMLDSEWQTHNCKNQKKPNDHSGRDSEKIHRLVLNLKNKRLLVESQVDKLCQLMKCHKNDIILLPPDDVENGNNTFNGDANTSICGKMSSKNMESLQRILSERKHTPVRNFSTQKKNMSMNSRDLSLKFNLEESLPSEPPSKQDPLLALKSFVSKTAQVEETAALNVLSKSAEIPPNSSLPNSAYMAGIDDAVWQQYTLTVMSPMGNNLTQQQILAQSTAKSSISSEFEINKVMVTNGAAVTPTASKSSSKSVYPSTSLPGSMLQQTGLNQSAIFPAANPTFTMQPNTAQKSAAVPLQSPNTANIFNLPFIQQGSQQQNSINKISVKPSMSTDSVPSAGMTITPIVSPKFTGQTQFGFNTNFGSLTLGTASQHDVRSFNADNANISKPGINLTPSNVLPQLLINSDTSITIINSDKIPKPPTSTINTTFSQPTINNNTKPFNTVFSSNVPKSQVIGDSTILDTTQLSSSPIIAAALTKSANPKNTSTVKQPPSFGVSVVSLTPVTVSPPILVNLPVTNTTTPVVASSNEIASSSNTSVIALSQFSASSVTSSATSIFVAPNPSSSGSVGITVTAANPVSISCAFSSIPTTCNTSGSFASVSTIANSSVFGGMAVSNTSNYSSFGGAITTTSNSSVFGSNVSTSTISSTFADVTITSISSAFGGTATTSNSSAFGGTTTSNSSAFGGATTIPISSTFGGVATIPNSSTLGGVATISNSSEFGVVATTLNSGTFGGVATTSNSTAIGDVATTSNSNLFGKFSSSTFGGWGTSAFGGVVTTTSSSSAFGVVATTASSSLFGGVVATTSSSSIFGSSTDPSASIFGKAGSNTLNQSIFGGTVPSSSSSYGGSSVTDSVNAFGNKSNNTFGSIAVSGSNSFTSNGFGGSASKPFGTENNVFGSSNQNSASGPFGNTNSFGNSTNSNQGVNDSSSFGSTVPTNNVFGATNNSQGAFGGQTSLFRGNSNTTSTFGNQANCTTKPFGVFGNNVSSNQDQSSFSGLQICSDLGKTPDAAKASQNVFGAVASPINANNNLFTGNSCQPISSPFKSDTFGTAKSTASAFGATASFGSPAAFGGGATFGGTGAFGSGSVFGGSISSPVQSTTQSFQNSSPSIFGNQSEGSSFGALAQQQNNDTFEEKSFGGNAFSSWR